MTRQHRHPVASLLAGRHITTLAAARIVHDLAKPAGARGLGLMSVCELADEIGVRWREVFGRSIHLD